MFDSDDGGEGSGGPGATDGGSDTPTPSPTVGDAETSATATVNDRSAGGIGLDPLGISGLGAPNSCFGDSLGYSSDALGNAAAALSLVLMENQSITASLINCVILQPGPYASSPYSLLTDIERFWSGQPSPSAMSYAWDKLSEKIAENTVGVLGGAAFTVLMSEVAIPAELAGIGLLTSRFQNGWEFGVSAYKAYQAGAVIAELPEKAMVRVDSLESAYSNSRPSIFASPTPMPGPTPSSRLTPDMSYSNPLLLK